PGDFCHPLRQSRPQPANARVRSPRPAAVSHRARDRADSRVDVGYFPYEISKLRHVTPPSALTNSDKSIRRTSKPRLQIKSAVRTWAALTSTLERTRATLAAHGSSSGIFTSS